MSKGAGWRGWPATAPQLGQLALGLLELKRAASYPPETVVVINLAAVAAVAKVIHFQGGAA